MFFAVHLFQFGIQLGNLVNQILQLILKHLLLKCLFIHKIFVRQLKAILLNRKPRLISKSFYFSSTLIYPSKTGHCRQALNQTTNPPICQCENLFLNTFYRSGLSFMGNRRIEWVIGEWNG